jgi:hypothetical protein
MALARTNECNRYRYSRGKFPNNRVRTRQICYVSYTELVEIIHHPDINVRINYFNPATQSEIDFLLSSRNQRISPILKEEISNEVSDKHDHCNAWFFANFERQT